MNWSIALTVAWVSNGLAKRFGKCVRELRTEAGLTQVEFAERCGFYQTYLSRVETGQANPTINAIEVIANGLGLSVFDLFDRLRSVK
ncbi:helix-turn-helix domain-containing protein [Paucibacter sp. XJ19-41]|uniref:helix-turn-helix domain-containing protein n=1 Tax=Paucibacter sp. XJ19-41 TaxID=2927824 RepID=UPI00300DD892